MGTFPLHGKSSVSKSNPIHLRIHQELPSDPSKAGSPEILINICRCFEDATGWPLKVIRGECMAAVTDEVWSAPVDQGIGENPGYLAIVGKHSERSTSRTDLTKATQLAGTIAKLASELSTTRRALWQAEAELAAGIPVISRGDDDVLLAARLEAILKGGVEAVGCEAAGLYMLDAATTELKLRSCWGLPASRLTSPARPLRGAIGDLEALAGSAVVLEDNMLHAYWKVPEACGSAVCVPVATPTTLLGTLWVFCELPREFTDIEANQIEMIAGRIAAELEREVLISEGFDSEKIRQGHDQAIRLQQNQCPQVSPLLDGWDLAGWTQQALGLGGDFFDWLQLADGQLAVMLGDAQEQGPAAALVAQALRTAMRTHAEYAETAGDVLTAVNRTLWTGSAGDEFAAALFGMLDPATGQFQFSVAGNLSMLAVHGQDWRPLQQMDIPLAIDPDATYATYHTCIEPGETMLAFTDGPRESLDAEGQPLGEALLAAETLRRPHIPATELLRYLRDHLESHRSGPPQDDCTIFAIRRDARQPRPHRANP